jgi:phenylacetate-CoA oxygenase PaaJ subunit
MSSIDERVWEALGSVADPEYPVSIVDLGMVYDVRVEDGLARIALTFTSVGCPAVDMIPEDIETAVRAVPGVRDLQIDVTWSPPWTKERISERGRRVLAMYGVV